MCPVKLLLPANVVCEGYVFTPVCDSVNWGGVYPGGVWDTPSSGQTPPPSWADTPWADNPPGQTPPWADIPPRQTPPWADTP